jgi:hypothetical protein
MIWKMVFARNEPSLLAVAQSGNPEAFAYHAAEFRGRPAESWIWSYLSYIPMRR